MKNNKILIIIGILLLNVLVIYMISQSFLGKASEYEKTVKAARDYAEQELCSKSIAKYEEALVTEDSVALRLEMIDVYEKGIDIGEFTKTYDIFASVVDLTETYREDIRIYERVCDILIKYEKYEECANVLMKARDFNLKSDKLSAALEEVRYRYTKFYAMYTDLLPVFEGRYTVALDNNYRFITDEASTDIKGAFIYASSFSEGYAFVKDIRVDGTEKAFLIDKEGQRQVYFDGVESSSGVGRAVDKNGNTVGLLSCKIGDKYKYYDVNAKEAFGEYAFAGRFRNNVAAVMEEEGKWKLINGAGKEVTDTVFADVVLNEFDECAPKGYIIAKESDKYHIYDLTAEGKLVRVGDFECDGAKAFVDEYAAFKSGDLWGFVGTDGKIIIEAQYEDAKSFSNGMGAIKAGAYWKFINAKNEVVVEDDFEDCDYLNSKGICFVKEDGYWSYLKFYYTAK